MQQIYRRPLQVKLYKLIADERSIANEIFSPTMKIKQKIIAKRYAGTIEKLFSPEGLESEFFRFMRIKIKR